MQENDHLVEHEIPSAAPKQLLDERFLGRLSSAPIEG
jgi:hypothetical protein